ncbi:vacuolar sorting protein VPS33/slp1 [Podila epigama]|nr:vacuolar sorting protein VPS33/slp1 [Podila epigama]
MPPHRPTSIAATLAAHRSKTAILNKYQSSSTVNGNSSNGGDTFPPSSSIDSSSTSSTVTRLSLAAGRSNPQQPTPQTSLRAPPSASATPSSATTSSSAAAASSSSIPQSLPIHLDQVVSGATGSQINICCYNTTGEYILAGGVDRTIRLWNAETKFCIKSYEAHGWEVLDLAVSPENGKFASCGGDKTVFLWDVLSGMTIRRFSGHTQRVNAVDFNDEGTVIASGSYDASIRSQLRAPIQVLEDPKDSVTSIQINGSNLLAGCVDGTIRMYDIRMGRLVTDQIFGMFDKPITSVSFSKDGNCVLASSLDDTIRLMDRENGSLLNAYKGHVNNKYKIRSCLSNSDAHVIAGSEDGKIYIWDLIEGEVVCKIDAHSKIVSSIAYHPKQDRMCSASVDGFLEAIDNVKVEPGRYKYVIVDTRAAEIMASAGCNLADVLAREGTMYLENLEKRRSPSAGVEAIYFAMPTEDSVRRIIRDFKVGRPATYSAAHLFFLAAMDDKMFDHLRASTDAKYIKSLKELFMDFYAVESRVFSLNRRNAFFNLLSPQLREINQHAEVNAIAKQTSKNIAMTVQTELDEYYKGQPRVGLKPPHLIIIDRTIDPITPILHDFYYQALATDLMPIKDGTKYDFTSIGQDGQPLQKTAILDETDKTFVKIRHNHITDCIKFLKTSVDDLMTESVSKPMGGNQLDILREQMAKLPQFQENKEKFSVHLEIVNGCLEYIQHNRIVDISNLEQSLATGQLANGEIPKSFDPEIASFLDDNTVRMVDRLRLIMLFFITQAVPQEMRNQLFQLSRCNYADREIANNLEFLGVKLDVAAPPPTKKWFFSDFMKKKSVAEDEIEYELPRYTPVIKSIFEGVVNENLDREQYPYTLAPDQLETIQARKTVRSLRSAQPTFHHKGRRNEPKGRLILFIAGGVTYNEIRCAYEAAAQHEWDILVGSTHIITPPIFMEDMRLLRSGPPPPPPPPPRSPSPPPEPVSKSSGGGAFASVKNVFSSPSSSSKPSAGAGLAQPQPLRPTSQLQQTLSEQKVKDKIKIKGLWK